MDLGTRTKICAAYATELAEIEKERYRLNEVAEQAKKALHVLDAKESVILQERAVLQKKDMTINEAKHTYLIALAHEQTKLIGILNSHVAILEGRGRGLTVSRSEISAVTQRIEELKKKLHDATF